MTGGNRIGKTGYYVEPTVFADVKDDMTIAREEVNTKRQSIYNSSKDFCNFTLYSY